MALGISGLSGSGLDTSALITAIMNQEKVPLNSLTTKKEVTTAYKDFFTALNTKTTTLRDAATALSDLSTYNAFSATSSSTSTLSTSTVGDKALAGTYSVTVANLAQKHVVASKSIDVSTTFAASGLPTTFTIKGQSIDLTSIGIKSDTTMGDALSLISNAINGLSGTGVKASVIQTESGKKSLVLTASDFGTANKVDIAQLDSNWAFAEKQEAKDAKITVNGVDITSSTNTVENAIEGVKLTLTGVGSSTVEVGQDISGITKKIETFVSAYNDIVNTIRNNTKASTENKDGSLSLTLMGDSLLRDMQTQLGGWMQQVIGSTDPNRDTKLPNILSDIGIEIDKGVTSASLMTGNITFNSTLLKEKMLANPEAVKNLLTGSSSGSVGNVGMADLFKDNLKVWTDSVDGLITMKVKGYSSDITFLSEQITSMSDRLDMKKVALEKKYANMEVMLSSLKSQSSYVSNILKSITGSSDK
ncbi:flagellar filament capping protein FliD [Paenibacillus sp. FSL K6-0276]|uniref:flagellar filament capping protein FliD n=1 Tax=Paenibacillus sp. FSL K6-0276 TaxID=2921450 RepID=UPI0030EEFA59